MIVSLANLDTNKLIDREEAKKEEEEFQLQDEDEYEDEEAEWGEENEWANEVDEAEDIKDESNAYLDFLNEEAAKIGALGDDDDDDDELEEESLLETPLDTVEPYALLRDGLMSESTYFLYKIRY